MMTKALRSGDTGCTVVEYGHGIIRDGTQAWHQCPHSHNNLTMVRFRNVDLEMDKNRCRD